MNTYHWFKHEQFASFDERMSAMIDKEGSKGYGTYWYIIERLFMQEYPELGFDYLNVIQKKGFSAAYMKKIITNYGLFILKNDRFSPAMRYLKIEREDDACQPTNNIQQEATQPENNNTTKIADKIKQNKWADNEQDPTENRLNTNEIFDETCPDTERVFDESSANTERILDEHSTNTRAKSKTKRKHALKDILLINRDLSSIKEPVKVDLFARACVRDKKREEKNKIITTAEKEKEKREKSVVVANHTINLINFIAADVGKNNITMAILSFHAASAIKARPPGMSPPH